MSDQTTNGEGQSTPGEGQKVNVDEILKRLEQLEGTNKRILEESKGHKKEASDYKSKLDAFEKKKVEESGDISAKLELQKKETEKILSENKSLRAKTLQQNVRSVVAKFAKDVWDLDDFINQSEFAKILQDGIDPENLTISDEAGKNFANAVLNKKPWMQKNVHQETVDTTRPNPKETSTLVEKSLDEQKEELKKLILQTKQ